MHAGATAGPGWLAGPEAMLKTFHSRAVRVNPESVAMARYGMQQQQQHAHVVTRMLALALRGDSLRGVYTTTRDKHNSYTYTY